MCVLNIEIVTMMHIEGISDTNQVPAKKGGNQNISQD
jgi:hypothetical protein